MKRLPAVGARRPYNQMVHPIYPDSAFLSVLQSAVNTRHTTVTNSRLSGRSQGSIANKFTQSIIAGFSFDQ
jgi:hypothetical protein